jgi:4'-phosphopantetheinyl transferase EntD
MTDPTTVAPEPPTGSLLAGLLPPPLSVAELLDPPAELGLFPAEQALVQNAVDKRRLEFAAVRHCARTALAELGCPPVPILTGEQGAPVWPPGIVGSMTHCQGYAAAAVAPADVIASVGVDAETNAPLPAAVEDLVCLPQERELLAQLAQRHPLQHWDRLLFSAKEAVYKTWFPLKHTWLGFKRAQVEIDPSCRTFRVRLLVPGPTIDGVRHDLFAGNWTVSDHLIVTAVVIHRGDDLRPRGPDPGQNTVSRGASIP